HPRTLTVPARQVDVLASLSSTMPPHLTIDFALTVVGQHRFFRLCLGLGCTFGRLAAAEGAVHRKRTRFDNVGIGHDIDAGGTPALECALERRSDAAGLIDELAMSAQSLCRAFIMDDAQLSSDRAAGTPREYLAMLRHTPLHIVVDDHGNWQVVPDRGIELREVETDRSIADDA